jgi:hypothetical protein
MKRFLFVIFACLSLCSYAQVPFNNEVVTGSFAALNGQVANLDIVYEKIHNMSEADFAEYEKDWNVDKPEIEGYVLERANKALEGLCYLKMGKEADLTVRILVNTVSVKGDHSFEVQLLDKSEKVQGTISGLFGKGGMFGTKLNLIKDGAKSTGKRAGALLRKYIKK